MPFDCYKKVNEDQPLLFIYEKHFWSTFIREHQYYAVRRRCASLKFLSLSYVLFQTQKCPIQVHITSIHKKMLAGDMSCFVR